MGTLRKNRGNSWEYKLCDLLTLGGYQSRRMGGTTLGFPDVIATNNEDKTILAIEAKSSEYDHIYVPIDQINRCFRLLDMFSLYEHKYAIVSFKFMDKKGNKKTRELTKLIKAKQARLKQSNVIVSKNSLAFREIKRLFDNRRDLSRRQGRYYHFIINPLRENIKGMKYTSIRCTYDGVLVLIVGETQTLIPVTNLEHMTFNNREVILPHKWAIQRTLI